MEVVQLDYPQYSSSELKGSSIWQELNAKRSGHLVTARQCAELTKPRIQPPDGFSENEELHQPRQGLGAEAINTLTSKLSLTLFPPNVPFFKISVDEILLHKILGDINKTEVAKIRAELDYTLSQLEVAAMNLFNAYGWRAAINKALTSCVVTGDSLLILDEQTNKLRFIRLDNWACIRDASGSLVQLIIREYVHKSTLDKSILSLLDDTKEDVLTFYSLISRVNKDSFKLIKFIEDQQIPNSKKTYTSKELPFLLSPWDLAVGENYSRGLVEDHLGDLRSYEALSIAIGEYAAIASKIIPLVNPAASIDIEEFTNSANGQPLPGRKDDITFVTVDKYMDMRSVAEEKELVEQRIKRAFLMTSSIQRNAERVTAVEIQMMSRELESALGGVYSLLAVHLQMPIANFCLNKVEHMIQQSLAPLLHSDALSIKVTTGIEGLGRHHEFQSIGMFLSAIQPFTTLIQSDIKVSGILKKLATALSLNINDIIKSEEEKALEAQAQQQALQQQQLADMVSKGVPNAIKGISDSYNKGEQIS